MPIISSTFNPLLENNIFNSSGVINFDQSCVPFGSQPKIYSTPIIASP